MADNELDGGLLVVTERLRAAQANYDDLVSNMERRLRVPRVLVMAAVELESAKAALRMLQPEAI
jgi:hypothetical protein